ncbi:MAG: exosortase C-terminal domain/associated protein EpsI [Candidatus Brocadiales bacterium]
MRGIDQRHLVVIILLAITASFTFLIDDKKGISQNYAFTESIPTCIGPWAGRDFEVDARTIEMLETDDILMREYRRPKGLPISLCIAFSGEKRVAIHPPEICMSGGGWNLVEKKRIKVSDSLGLVAIKLILERGDCKQVVLYWYKAGKDFTASFYHQQLNFVKNWILGGDPSCGLIRVSTQIKGQGVEQALSSLIEFTRVLMPHLTEEGKPCQQKRTKDSV